MHVPINAQWVSHPHPQGEPQTLVPYLVIINLTAKVHPPHVLHQDVHSVSAPSGGVYYQCVVSLQQALEHLHVQTHTYQVQGHNTSLNII